MWRTVVASVCLVFTLTQSIANTSLKLSHSIYNPAAFISHQGASVGYWLGRNVNYASVAELLARLKVKLPGEVLHNRGDAHITVITPPEYLILKSYLSPQLIDQIAQQEHIQRAKFQVDCLGRGQARNVNRELMKTYFLVVKSTDLLRIRKILFEAYVAHGGMPSHFDPEHFTPHITVGFTERDLFEQDGVFKQYNACFLPVKLSTK